MKRKNRNNNECLTETVTENKPKDTSPKIPQRSKINFDLHIYQRPDLTSKQSQFLELANDKNTKIMFVSGPAGSSKTWCSVMSSLQLMNQRKISDLLYIRSVVESSERSIGFLKGDIDEKFSFYIQPLMDKLEELLPKNEIEALIKDERITGIPIGFLRGLNWNAKAIILDESQNCSFKELFTFITRIGQFSKVFILGDESQSDINGKSGFVKMISHFDDEESRQNGVHIFRFTEEDIVRSGLVQFIVRKLKNKV